MIDIKKQQITCLHGWLFGSYIWTDIHKYFGDTKKTKLISLSGYNTETKSNDDYKIISDILKTQNDNDIILAYSYSASLILSSKDLNSCKGKIFLVNPFFTIKKEVIDKLIIEMKKDLDHSIKKFIYEATKGDDSHKKNYSKLYKTLKINFVPSLDTLCYGLANIKKLSNSSPPAKKSNKIHIIQSTNDQITDLNFFYKCEKQKFNTYRLEGATHYPFFEFDKIYAMIKDKL